MLFVIAYAAYFCVTYGPATVLIVMSVLILAVLLVCGFVPNYYLFVK